MIVNYLLEDLRVAKTAHTEGVVILLEGGHKNNPEAKLIFNELRKKYTELQDVLRSIDFIPKINCRAVQMADLLAFYSRRRADKLVTTPKKFHENIEMSDEEKVVFSALPYRNFVATAFGDQDPPVPYLRDFLKKPRG